MTFHIPPYPIFTAALHLTARPTPTTAQVAQSLLASGTLSALALHFPIWKADYASLMADLVASGAAVEVAAVPEPHPGAPGIRVGAHGGVPIRWSWSGAAPLLRSVLRC